MKNELVNFPRDFEVWYMKPSFFRDGIMRLRTADPKNLKKTHVLLTTLNIDGPESTHLEKIYLQMQGESWSPRGEARPLIDAKGLRHTSMSVGDVIVDTFFNNVYVVDSVGFKDLGKRLDK